MIKHLPLKAKISFRSDFNDIQLKKEDCDVLKNVVVASISKRDKIYERHPYNPVFQKHLKELLSPG